MPRAFCSDILVSQQLHPRARRMPVTQEPPLSTQVDANAPAHTKGDTLLSSNQGQRLRHGHEEAHISADASIWGAVTSNGKVSLQCPAERQDTRGYFQPLDSAISARSRQTHDVEERRTCVLTSSDVKSITTYWEASECCCSYHRCFQRLTCQRHFLPTSLFCPCGWSSVGGAFDAGSSWARAHQYKMCGGLQESKTADEPTDTVRAGKLNRTAQTTLSNWGWRRKTDTQTGGKRNLCAAFQKMDFL